MADERERDYLAYVWCDDALRNEFRVNDPAGRGRCASGI